MALQNHIHLALTLGSAPENSPIYKWRIRNREDVVVGFADIERSIGGMLHVNVAHDDDGNQIQLNNFAYEVKVTADYGYTVIERIAQLKAMNHRRVKLCDSFHAVDGADHTADVRNMFVSKIGTFPTDHTALQFFYVQVELEDDSL